LRSEDILKERETYMVKAEIIDRTFTVLDDYQENLQLRNF